MSDDISPKEWETMSAYLDGQLGRKEQDRLERSLDQNPSLFKALEDLSQIRSQLHSQPKIRATRNFTLTPELAGVNGETQKSGFALPVLRAVSILASVLFVFVFASDLLTSGSSLPPESMVRAPEQESAIVEKAAPQLAMSEKAMESVETGQVESSMAFELEQDELAAEDEFKAPARMLETKPQSSNDFEEAGEEAIAPEAVESLTTVEPSPLQESFVQRSHLQLLEVFLLVVAITAGAAVIYLNRRTQD